MQSRNSQPFWKPEGPIPCSQKSATELYPKPDETSRHAHTRFL